MPIILSLNAQKLFEAVDKVNLILQYISVWTRLNLCPSGSGTPWNVTFV